MYARYSPRGLATLNANRNRLFIRMPRALFDGQQKDLYLGLNDTPKNRSLAQRRLEAINNDIVNDCFDASLEKYKPQAKKQSHLLKIRAAQAPSIVSLYEQYITERREQVSPNTYAQNYLLWLDRLQKDFIPETALKVSEDSAYSLLQILETRFTPNANFRLFQQLNACTRWAISRRLISVPNPYPKVLELLPKPKKKKRNPVFFDKDEISAILAAFSESQYYNHYTNYVAFLFATGARPSEAVCLTWSDIDSRFIHFTKRLVVTENGKQVFEGTKSENYRKFPLNQLLKTILKNQRDRHLKGELIFPSPTGKYIHIQNFSRRAWKKILEGLEYKYKRPYTSRASFITHTLEHLDSKDIARVCGNSPETIYRHYAGSNVSSLVIPEVF